MTDSLRWLFVGQGDMGAAALDAAVAALASTLPPVGVLAGEPALGEPPVTAVARAHDLVVRHTDRLGPDPGQRWPELVVGVDLAVCCCWTERLAPEVLRLPTHGWLNLHPSALPAWRGADPVAWQLLAAPSQIGCSVHRMTERHDDGPVVAQDRLPVGPDDDRGMVAHRSGALLGRLVARVLGDLAAGASVAERAQDEQEATWCPPPGTVPMIDPRHMRAAEAGRVARAFSPEPGVGIATLSGDQRFAVTGTGAAVAGDPPGAVVAADDGTVAIAFVDRWLHGRTWRLASERPSRVDLAAPGASRLPRGRS